MLTIGRVRRVNWSRGLDWLIVLVTGIFFAIAWPTLHVTHSVSAPIQPVVAALAAGPFILIRANPALGWAISAISALVIPIAFASTPGNEIPWQVVHILVLLPLLFAVSLRTALPIVGVAWVSTVLLFVANMGPGARAGWTVLLTATVVVALLVRWLVLSRRQLAEQEEVSELERARRTVLEEKARIARDLHDVVAHHMSLVVVQAQTAAYRVPDVSPSARAEFESIGATAREALNEIRGILGVLRSDGVGPEHAPQPGTAQVEELLEGSLRAGVPLSWNINGDRSAISETTGLAVYRILQESLSNASRHAPGAPVRVTIEYGLALVSLSVVNEAATAPQQVSHDATGGSGIGGMRDRALAVGGLLTATPRAEGGFEVMAQLPVGVVAGFAHHSA
ncbi:sensor histidine kinase [Antrihabitans stalactiti]|uniref:histidine kinase n=1 Tax=Antrihabitans stalactiti TaxID=2584121 RepID=A0A848K7T7_9NOCA|nr:histidine kinase [Antrihabitans stalactiti]NMN94419.1 sensor histidine kinase [Antrihabitans stalactiti]